ncbi:MAG: alpha/beta fold hydrolase [Bacteroidia bacterium]
MRESVIILHGALGSNEQFADWKEALSDKYDCYSFDFSGHGSKSSEGVQFSIELFSEELAVFIKERKLDKPVIIGYSMGGYVALYTALNPENPLGNVMTIATKFDWNPESSKREAGYLNPEIMQAKVPAFAEQLKQRHGSHWENLVKKTAALMLRLGENPPVTIENIKSIQNKIKFCVGDKDKMVSIAETQAMYKNATNANFCVMPDTAHLPETMSVERIKFEVEEFMR